MNKKMLEYRFKDPFLQGNPQLMGETISDLEKEKKKGESLAKLLVEKARPEDSSIHSYFEWNDYIVAEKYRLHQAREYINGIERIEVEVIGKEEIREKPQRAFISVKIKEIEEKDQPTREYIPFTNVMEDENTRNIHIKEVWLELVRFRKKYEYLEEHSDNLKIIFKQIDSMK